MEFIITTITKVNTDLIYQAQALAQKFNKKFVTRNNLSLERLKQDNNVDNIFIFTKDGLKAHTSQGDLFFHLNMAQLRILTLNRNQKDHMVEAMDLKPKMSVLDCTLGLGTDATVASYIVGENGKVVGLESATLIYLITKYGLANFNHDNIAINHSLRRIESFNLHYLDYLKAQGDNSFDIVYFDPMFRKPIQDSANFKPMRAIANMEQLQSKALVEALRVAKKRVVIKETKDSMEFKRLNISQIYGGKYSSVSYGVIDKG